MVGIELENTDAKSHLSYMPQLDGLRAIAVASVAYSHWVPPKYHFGLPWGSAGVQLFFVLSGFLITGILLRCRTESDRPFAARAFYARRFLRIFPIFYLVLLLAFVGNLQSIRETILWHVTYLSNFRFLWIGNWEGHFSHFWSLAVEEQFYLFWPVVILCVPKKYLTLSVLLLVSVGVLSRLFLPILFPETRLLTLLPTSNFAALGLGAMLAYFADGKSTRYLNFFCLAGIPTYLLLYVIRSLGYDVPLLRSCEYLAMILSFTCLIHAASKGFTGIVGSFLELPVILYLGKISYGLYVLHPFASIPACMIFEATGFPLLKYGILSLVLKAVITIVVASLSWYLFESPINSLKQRFPYHKRALDESI